MKKMIQKMELAFWDRVIPLLSDSPLVRSSIQKGYALAQEKPAIMSSLLIGFIGASGLLIGVCLGNIISFFR
ncbi:MAG TPA: hypothetical protein PKW33_05550 [Anaerolineaceae bacterium]|nr:hypothetical protein [Anaerolineaceae bacterium]HPN51031.1 hypothetical protein [Anaerolineaceae bacterium]